MAKRDFEQVTAAFARARGVTLEKGWGSGNLVLKRDGKIFAISHGRELVVKLPKPRVDELVAGGARRFDPRKNGRVMKEWVVVTGGDWVALAREAHAFSSAKTPGTRSRDRRVRR